MYFGCSPFAFIYEWERRCRMFVSIVDHRKKNVTIETVLKSTLSVGLLTIDELLTCYKEFDFSEETLKYCEADVTHFSTNIEIHDEYSFGMLNVINVMDVNLPREKVAFYIKKMFF